MARARAGRNLEMVTDIFLAADFRGRTHAPRLACRHAFQCWRKRLSAKYQTARPASVRLPTTFSLPICNVLMKFFNILLLFTTFGASAQKPYTIRNGDPDGINKWYMGRQIAHVMSHYGIEWLERSEREEEEKSSVLLKDLNLKPNMVVADIGAGSGYYSVRLSKLVPIGTVLAVDIEPEMLKFINDRVKKEGEKNIKTVLGKEQSVSIAPGTVDVMLLVDVYHEFSYPKEMSESMLAALKPGGEVYLVEYRAEDKKVPIKAVHKMTEAQARKEFTAIGFEFVKNIPNLPWQHCLVFRKAVSTH